MRLILEHSPEVLYRISDDLCPLFGGNDLKNELAKRLYDVAGHFLRVHLATGLLLYMIVKHLHDPAMQALLSRFTLGHVLF